MLHHQFSCPDMLGGNFPAMGMEYGLGVKIDKVTKSGRARKICRVLVTPLGISKDPRFARSMAEYPRYGITTLTLAAL